MLHVWKRGEVRTGFCKEVGEKEAVGTLVHGWEGNNKVDF